MFESFDNFIVCSRIPCVFICGFDALSEKLLSQSAVMRMEEKPLNSRGDSKLLTASGNMWIFNIHVVRNRAIFVAKML